jgi:hypothetical protein
MRNAVRNYALVTGAYWGFTLTDGALRMLVLLLSIVWDTAPWRSLFCFYFTNSSGS